MRRSLPLYVAKRLALVVPTFFGISLVTFALLHWLPGDPNQTEGLRISGGSLKAHLTENRRLFRLDQPLFVNLNPTSLGETLWRVTRSGDDVLLKKLGTLLTPYLLGASSIDPSARRSFKHVSPGGLRDQRSATIGRLLKRLDVKNARQQLRRIGAAATIELVKQLGGHHSKIAANLLADIHRKPLRIADDDLPAQRAGVIKRWQMFGKQLNRHLRVLPPAAYAMATLSDTQYASWLRRLAVMDFGVSLTQRVPVAMLIADSIGNTFILGLAALLIALLIGIPMGVLSAVKSGSYLSWAITLVTVLLFSLPSYWVATIVIQTFAGMLEWFPAIGLHSVDADQLGRVDYGLDLAWHMILPISILAYGLIVVFTQYTASSMNDALRQPFLLTAKAKGAPFWHRILRHGLRNSLLTLISLGGLLVPTVITGSIIVEKVFDIQGMGMLTYRSIVEHDYPTVMAVVTIAALVTMAGILISDLALAAADPRVSDTRSM